MDFDLLWLVPIVAAVVAAVAGAYVSARLGWVHAERAEVSRVRRESAEEIIRTLTKLRDLLRNASSSRDVDEWAAAVTEAYDAIDDARHRLPQEFRHFKRSVRYALGEAVGGVSLADLQSSRERADLADYDHRWNEYAIEYLELAIVATRAWRDASAAAAPKLRLPDFDQWLARTDRHVSGGTPA